METTVNNDEIEIDLGLIFRLIMGKLWIILMSGAICALLAFIISEFIMPAKYESTAQLYIINRQNEGTTTYSDIQTSTQLVKDYQVLVVSRPVVEQVISNLDLSMDAEEFIENVSVNIASDSRVLTLSITNEDPYLAKRIVDNLADVSSKRICSVMQIDGVNIIEYGNIPSVPSEPNVKMFTAAGLLLGLFGACAVIILVYMLDDSIKTADDIERYLGLSTLALIPLSEEEYDGQKRNIKKRKKKNLVKR